MTTLRAVASIFLDLGGWSRLFSGGILTLGLSTREWAVVFIGVCAMLAVSKMKFGMENWAERILADHPFVASACATLLTLTIMIFGSYGIGFEKSSFIYSKF